MFDRILVCYFLLRHGAEENKDIEAVAVGCGLWYPCMTEDSIGKMQQDGNYDNHHDTSQPGVVREP